MAGGKNAAVGVVAAAVIAAGGYWYWSPVLALKEMRAAAEKGDADGFNNYVDYPRVRESLKGHLSAHMAESLGETSKDTTGIAAVGAALGAALIGSMVDAFVRPEVVMRVMQSGKLGAKEQPAAGTAPASEDKSKLEPVAERKGMDKYVVHLREKGSTDDVASLVMERSGFATWKLTELRPALPKK